jgi:hypothetical protein
MRKWIAEEARRKRYPRDGTLAHGLLDFCGDGDAQSGLGAYVRGNDDVSLDGSCSSMDYNYDFVCCIVFCACSTID